MCNNFKIVFVVLYIVYYILIVYYVFGHLEVLILLNLIALKTTNLVLKATDLLSNVTLKIYKVTVNFC